MATRHHARERLTAEAAEALLPAVRAHAAKLLARVGRIRPLPAGADVLDVGAGQGLFLLACAELGCRAVGVEPSPAARQVGQRLLAAHAAQAGPSPRLIDGRAERLPLPEASVDFVHANSVIEHVDDPAAAFAEAFRVLRPGGVFWFSTASSVCPRQNEIALLPLFGWYPDRLKRRIMRWAQRRAPGLVGHTDHPAMHWFSPRKARRMLRAAGFARVLDRWDFRLPGEGGREYRAALSVIRRLPPARWLADVLVEGCNYAAVKPAL